MQLLYGYNYKEMPSKSIPLAAHVGHNRVVAFVIDNLRPKEWLGTKT